YNAFADELYKHEHVSKQLFNPDIPQLDVLIPKPLRSILRNILQTDPNRRPTIVQLLTNPILFDADALKKTDPSNYIPPDCQLSFLVLRSKRDKNRRRSSSTCCCSCSDCSEEDEKKEGKAQSEEISSSLIGPPVKGKTPRRRRRKKE